MKVEKILLTQKLRAFIQSPAQIPALLFALILAFPCLLPAQTLRGLVRDADNGQPVLGATVTLQRQRSGTNVVSAATNPSGEFDFNQLLPGYYRCTVSAEGFENQIIVEVNVAAGKEQALDIGLRRASTALPALTVTANNIGRRPVRPLSEITLTRDQTLRFPSMYFDPGRLAAAYAGVAQTDDGINGMSIRGNGPQSVRWRLEGAEVVNPNHLPNAGTFSDRPAAASGGVLMFSAQLLDNSSLLTGAFPAGYGDALGGVMDMRLRRGNRRQHEFTAQAGLIGLDIAAEGPLRRNGAKGGEKASYLVNYRYSTVGLLGKMGVSFGDETINFQDLSFLVSFSGKKGSEWRVFGLGGLSENIFEHKTDTAEIKRYKDFFDINFESKTGILGVSNWSSLGKKTWLKTAVVASGQTSERRSVHRADLLLNSSDDLQELKISGTATLSHRFSERLRSMAGILFTQQQFSSASTGAYQPSQGAPDHRFLTTQPWAEADWQSRNERTRLQLGLHTLLFTEGKESSIEPRLTVTQTLSRQHRLVFAVGRYSQIAPLWLLPENLKLQRAWQLGLRHAWQWDNDWALRSELFWQHSASAGVDATLRSTFSLINAPEYDILAGRQLAFNGASENRGLEITVERPLSEAWFFLANATIFDSRYQGSDALWRSTRWDLGHLANLTAGREWLREKSGDKTRSFGLNGRAVWTGGFREMPVDLTASAASSTTVFRVEQGFAIRQPDYFRFDVRVYWKRSLGNRRNSTFAMDFQNVTAQKNQAYHYYDLFTKKVETKYQLGLIPNLSWRVEF